MPMAYVQVPDDRLAVLLDEDVQARIEHATNTQITIDRDAKTVSITADNSINELDGKEVVTAISHGFEPSTALSIIHSDSYKQLESINISHYSRHDDEFHRLKGRLIGENGRTRELMEELTGAKVVIYRKSISFIGEPDQINAVRKAVKMLLDGAPHRTAYNYLEHHPQRPPSLYKDKQIPNLRSS